MKSNIERGAGCAPPDLFTVDMVTAAMQHFEAVGGRDEPKLYALIPALHACWYSGDAGQKWCDMPEESRAAFLEFTEYCNEQNIAA
jgi:hypothetical protein